MRYTGAVTDAKQVLINPLYAVRLSSDRFYENHEPTLAKEDWVKANDMLIEQYGAETWLRKLITTLSEAFSESLISPVNPYHAVVMRKPDGDAIFDCEEWIAKSTHLITAIGASRWLWQLLDILESGEYKVLVGTE